MKITIAVLMVICAEVCFGGQRSYVHQTGYGGPGDHGDRSGQDIYGEGDIHGDLDGRKDQGVYGETGVHENQDGYGKKDTYVVKDTYNKKDYKAKQCYQCAYSPPKTYYENKVYVEKHPYGREYEAKDRYGNNEGYGPKRGSYGGYVKKTVVPEPYTVQGGWDKCMGPFDHYQAKAFGVDVWDCHSNCYTRKDPSGDIYRGCYKGEFGVDPHRYGCSKQAGATWCFCEGEKCNNEAAPAYKN